MEIADRIPNYISLLEIRQKSRRWNVIFLGGIFLVAFLSTLALGLVSGIGGRTIYLIAGIDVALGFSFLAAWIRLEIVRNAIELLTNIQP